MSMNVEVFEQELAADAQSALRFIKQITARVRDMIFVIDLTTNDINFINEPAIAYLGHAEEFRNKKGAALLKEQVHPEDQLRYLLHLEACRLLKHGADRSVEIRLRSVQGHSRWFEVNSSPYKRDDGLVSQSIFICTDIQERKPAQAELKTRAEEDGIEDHQAVYLKGQLVKTLVHEIRNPVTSIKLAVASLGRCMVNYHGNPDTPETLISVMQRNTAYIERLLKKLLQLTAVVFEEQVRCELRDIIERSLSLAKDRVALAGAQVEKSCPLGHYITCNPELLQTAILNIIINAVEAMEAGKGMINILVQSKDEHIVLVIKDNGHGMNPEEVRRIFDPYYTNKPDGFGIGLASTKLILHQHKARVEVNSEQGTGTSFFIYFPRG
jgi:PAS domain S-box-containing protein